MGHPNDLYVDTEAVALLRTISAQLDALPAMVAAALAAALIRDSRPRQAPALSPKDRARLAALLPVLRALVGDANFVLKDLTRHAAMDARVREAMLRAAGPLDAGATRRLGGLLKRGAGIPIGGLRVDRCEFQTREGALWVIVKVCESDARVQTRFAR